jgi:predicted transcriptional regulator of viral defense system
MIGNKSILQKLRKLGSKGPFRAIQAQALGISRTALVRFLSEGKLVRISRGLYSLPDAPITGNETFVEISIKAPNAVVCLLSALEFHGMTTQLHPATWIAIEQGEWRPRGMSTDLRVVRFSGAAFHEGIEKHLVNGVTINVYSLAKTIADCFRYRNRIGMDVAVEALRESIRGKKAKPTEIRKFAEQRGVAKTIGPYLEAFLG